MASDLDFVKYIVELLDGIGHISYRKMMGEYLLYINNVYTVAICDNDVFLKIVPGLENKLKEIVMKPMYPGAKPTYLIRDFEDREYFMDIVRYTYEKLVTNV